MYGRGYINFLAEWAHWSERVCWRLAVLLPLYQKTKSGYWKKLSKPLAVVIKWWGFMFLFYQLIFYDTLRFIEFLREKKYNLLVPYNHTIGYHGGLVLMVLLYGFAWIKSPSIPVESSPQENQNPEDSKLII